MALCTGCQHASKDDSSSGVLKVVQATMDGLAAHDSVALSKRVLADAVIQRWQTDSAGVWKTVTLTGAEFAARLGQPGPGFLERTWRETAWVDGDVASVTAPYDFWVDGACSHCGVDVLTLVRDSDGTWRVATISYTVDARGEQACRGRFPDMPLSPKSATRQPVQASLFRRARACRVAQAKQQSPHR